MNRYLIKVDISGIQKFIFDIPSDGAARQLKGRSFYVYVLTHIIYKMLQDEMGEKNVEEVYNGGGNLFAFVDCEQEDDLKRFREKLESLDFLGVLFPFLSYVKTEDDFVKSMSKLNRVVQRVKLQRKFRTEPFETKKNIKWEDYVEDLISSKGFTIVRASSGDNQISLGDYRVVFEGDNFKDKIHNKLPKVLDEEVRGYMVVPFDKIAKKSSAEGADEKIGVLKMDVDNLGTLFRDKTLEEYRRLSQALELFFTRDLYLEVLKDRIGKQEVYPVFAGGDDLFFIGSWHVMFDVAKEINDYFTKFQETLKLDIPLTLSAALIVAKPEYPMIRLAEEAEEALELAKKYRPEKNSICVFGQPIAWEEFDTCIEIKNKLFDLVVEKEESKAILQRIKSSDLGFRSLQDKALERNKIDFPKVYRLKYYLRNAKNEENRKVLEEIFDAYAKDLMKDFLHGHNNSKKSNPAKYVIAARWTELLTKNTK